MLAECVISEPGICHCDCVRLSVKRVDCDKMKECSAQIFIPHERTFILVLPT